MKIGIVYILFSYLFLTISCSNSDENKCSKLKRGEFYYKSDNSFEGSMIRRNDSVQTVIDKKTNKKQEQKITWTDPCAYRLYPSTGNKNDSLYPDLFPIKVTILDVAKDYYTVNVTSEYQKTNFSDTVWIARLPGGFKSIMDTLKQK